MIAMDKKSKQEQSNTNLELTKNAIVSLSEINTQIKELNDCALNDFSVLNKILGKYHDNVEIILKNISEINSIITDNDNRRFINNFEKLKSRIDKVIDKFNLKTVDNIKVFRQLTNKVNLFEIFVKNYKQNILTLKLLISSYKLNSAFNKTINQDLYSISVFSDNVTKLCSDIQKTIIDYKKSIDLLLIEFNKLKNLGTIKINRVIKKIYYDVTLSVEKHKNAVEQIPQLTQKTKNFFENINDVVTNLQYHDIIRQKIEHVHTTNCKIISDFNELIEKKDDISHEQYLSKLFQIKNIKHIQIAQLVLANKEYQNAIEGIIKRYVEITNDMDLVSKISYIHSSNNKLINTNKIEKKLSDALKLIEKLVSDNSGFEDIINNICFVEKKLDKKIRHLKKEDKELNKLIKKLKEYSKEHTFVNEITIQLETMFEFIQSNFSNLDNYINNELIISSNILLNYRDNIGGVSKNLLNTYKQLHWTISDLSKVNNKAVLLSRENYELSNSVSGGINSSIKNIKYYEFFELKIRNITVELSSLQDKLIIENYETLSNSKEKLSDIYERYTMESQRQIHEQIINNEYKKSIDNQ